jgi:hypothetical protein
VLVAFRRAGLRGEGSNRFPPPGLKKALSARDFADAGALLPGSSRGGDFEIITKRKFRCCEAPWFYGIPVVSIENGLQFC